jgi:radical SAM superfamily enzyme YgiQ (UPF0313 family)
MKNVYFVQAQDSFDSNMFLPYSSGILWAYAKQHKDVADNYQLVDIIYEKLPFEENIAKITEAPDWIFFSTYGWNTRYHDELSRQLKQMYPDAKIVFGGPNVEQSQSWLENHPWVDVVCWGEGENTVTELLLDRPWETIDGVAFLDQGELVKTAQRQRITDINQIPSAYLAGVFDKIIDSNKYIWLPLWETNRGCPYHCTFCDLGADYYNKMFFYSTERLTAELEYFSKKKLEWIEITDTNFGIYERDLELAKKIKQLNQQTGYPKKVNATWAKNSPDRVLEMSKILRDIDRGGVTLALQSQDPTTLNNIKRFNIANTRLKDLIQSYNDNNIPTYHDFILGLPGETVSSWKAGINQVLNYGTRGWLFAHPLEAYVNTEMGDPEYQQKHGIRTWRTTQFDYFVTPNPKVPLEYGNYVFETATMTRDEWIDCYMYVWLISGLYYLGFLQYTVDQISIKRQIPRSQIFLDIEQWVNNNPSLLNQEQQYNKDLMYKTMENPDERWGRQMFGPTDALWLFDSASAVIFQKHFDLFYKEARTMLIDLYGDPDFVDQCLYHQRQIVKVCDSDSPEFKEFCQVNYWWGRKVSAWKTDYEPLLETA